MEVMFEYCVSDEELRLFMIGCAQPLAPSVRQTLALANRPVADRMLSPHLLDPSWHPHINESDPALREGFNVSTGDALPLRERIQLSCQQQHLQRFQRAMYRQRTLNAHVSNPEWQYELARVVPHWQHRSFSTCSGVKDSVSGSAINACVLHSTGCPPACLTIYTAVRVYVGA